MKLEGTYEVPAPRKKVWAAFQDPKVLKKAIPGCEKLEAVGPDEYKATMKVGVAAVKGTFEGKVKITDKHAPDSYKMAVEGSGGQAQPAPLAEAPHAYTTGINLRATA